MRQGLRECALRGCVLLGLWVASVARAAGGSVQAEANVGGAQSAWTLLGDVELRRDETFLALGYAGARLSSDEALSHQVSVGVDHGLSEHWLVSGLLTGGLPKTTTTRLARARPALGLDALDTLSGHGSLGIQLAASYDSAGFSDVEFGVDLGLGLTGYHLRRQLLTRDGRTDTGTLAAGQDTLLQARPSVGARLMLYDAWELGLRGSFSFYSEDPLTAGQFSPEELEQALRRYVGSAEANAATRNFLRRRALVLAGDLTGRLQGLNALSGFPSAPVLFDLKPSVTYRFSSRLRGQLSYTLTAYVPGQGFVQVLGTRWTVRVGKPWRLWAAVALQSDHPQGDKPQRSALLSLGSEYTF